MGDRLLADGRARACSIHRIHMEEVDATCVLTDCCHGSIELRLCKWWDLSTLACVVMVDGQCREVVDALENWVRQYDLDVLLGSGINRCIA